MKMAIKDKNAEFLLVPPKQINSPGTPKLRAVTHENGHKTQKDEFLVMALKHVNLLGTPKPWKISHENVHKNQKTMTFWS